jgi:hypothetical protein
MRKLLLFSPVLLPGGYTLHLLAAGAHGVFAGALTALLALACFLMKGRTPDALQSACWVFARGFYGVPATAPYFCARRRRLTGKRSLSRPVSQTTRSRRLRRVGDGGYPFIRPTCRSLLYLDAKEASLEPGDLVTAKAELQLANGDIQKGDNTYYRSKGVPAAGGSQRQAANPDGKPPRAAGSAGPLRPPSETDR